MMQKTWKMTETLAYGYSSESTHDQWELSTEYQHDRISSTPQLMRKQKKLPAEWIQLPERNRQQGGIVAESAVGNDCSNGKRRIHRVIFIIYGGYSYNLSGWMIYS